MSEYEEEYYEPEDVGTTDFEAELAETYGDPIQVYDPIAAIDNVVSQRYAEMEARIGAQVEATASQLRMERVNTLAREAHEAMVQAYGPDWDKAVAVTDDANPNAPARFPVREAIIADGVRGGLPQDDALSLAKRMETHYLAETQKARPSPEQEKAAYVESLRDLAEREKGYGF